MNIVQEKYERSVVSFFGLEDAKLSALPIEANSKLGASHAPQTEGERKEMEGVPYRSLVGKLVYLVTVFRPDLTMAVSTLSRFCNSPGRAHWEAGKKVVRYLSKTVKEGIVYRNGEQVEAWGYSDASYGTCPDSMRSRSGYAFLSAGGAIIWGSKLQKVVALSSCEAEYMALTGAACEAVYLRMLQNDLGVKGSEKGVLILADNQSAIKLAENPVFHKRSKHIAIKWHFIRERVDKKEVMVKFVRTKEMAADMLTKHASQAVLEMGRIILGLEG